MTRFTLTINQAIKFVLNSASIMIGGEIFIPRLPSYDILQLTNIINNDRNKEVIGIRPGEKIHESMFSVHDNIIEKKDYFILVSDIQLNKEYISYYGPINTEKYNYNSYENPRISDENLKNLIFHNI
jgi:FlaA1/EpsC-like NDP-sugar epimerase